MTPEEAMKVADSDTPRRDGTYVYLQTTAAYAAARVLADALREAQAQTVQMREDAARVAEDATGRPEDFDAASADELLAARIMADTIAGAIRALPAPAARTYDDGVRDAARRVIEAVDACDREAERDPASQSSAPKVRYINAIAALRAALLSPAPAVAPVAAPKPCPDCKHASHDGASCEHYDRPTPESTEEPWCHCDRAPKPGPAMATVTRDYTIRSTDGSVRDADGLIVKPPFDAEAALDAAREAARTGLDLNPTVEARQIAHLLHRMLSDALAAGRGAR